MPRSPADIRREPLKNGPAAVPRNWRTQILLAEQTKVRSAAARRSVAVLLADEAKSAVSNRSRPH